MKEISLHAIYGVFWVLSFRLYFQLVSATNIVSETKDLIQHTSTNFRSSRIGQIRYHYDEDFQAQCSHVLVIGVGMAMSVDAYDGIGKQIAKNSSVAVVISNHNPGGLMKTSSAKYTNVLNEIYVQLGDLISICNGDPANRKFIIGGHSASGQAAFEAIQKDQFTFDPIAFVGLDPYEISEKKFDKNKPLRLPSLYWGLTETTCFVNKEEAALGAYRLTSPNAGGRVLYAIDNSNNKMTHCVFTDHGCGVGVFDVCSTKASFDWVHGSVAETVHFFITALESDERQFNKSDFELPKCYNEKILLYVNDDDVKEDSSDSNANYFLLWPLY